MVTDRFPQRSLRVIGWTKSRRSEQSWTCVEIASDGDRVRMRDSKNPSNGELSFGAATWRAFIADMKSGAFDHE